MIQFSGEIAVKLINKPHSFLFFLVTSVQRVYFVTSVKRTSILLLLYREPLFCNFCEESLYFVTSEQRTSIL